MFKPGLKNPGFFIGGLGLSVGRADASMGWGTARPHGFVIKTENLGTSRPHPGPLKVQGEIIIQKLEPARRRYDISVTYRAVRLAGWRPGRRGKVLAKRTSCATLRTFSAKGSRASFWRISGFITLASLIYTGEASLPNGICRARLGRAIARCVPYLSSVRHWRRWR